jgi:hypothetical protein
MLVLQYMESVSPLFFFLERLPAVMNQDGK